MPTTPAAPLPAQCHALRNDLEVLEVVGADAPTFLQGQCTADVQGLAIGQWTWSGYCTPKGRLLSVFRAGRSDSGYLLQLPAGTAEPLAARLRKYVLRAKVTLAPPTALATCLWVRGADATARCVDALGVKAVAAGEFRRSEGIAIFGVADGMVVHLAAAQYHQMLVPALVDILQVGRDVAVYADIVDGLPWIDPALEDAFVPQMVGLDRIGGVSFSKGCYPGQEIVARTRYLGTVKRHLYQVAMTGWSAPGAAILTGDQQSGTLLRSVRAGDDRFTGLAVIDGAGAEAGHLHTAEGPIMDIRRIHPDA